jgi:hypothetical protein
MGTCKRKCHAEGWKVKRESSEWVEMLGWYMIHIAVKMMEDEEEDEGEEETRIKLSFLKIHSLYRGGGTGGRDKINKGVNGKFGSVLWNFMMQTHFQEHILSIDAVACCIYGTCENWQCYVSTVKLMMVTACRE